MSDAFPSDDPALHIRAVTKSDTVDIEKVNRRYPRALTGGTADDIWALY